MQFRSSRSLQPLFLFCGFIVAGCRSCAQPSGGTVVVVIPEGLRGVVALAESASARPVEADAEGAIVLNIPRERVLRVQSLDALGQWHRTGLRTEAGEWLTAPGDVGDVMFHELTSTDWGVCGFIGSRDEGAEARKDVGVREECQALIESH